MTIPITFVVVTKNECKNLARCLSSLDGFDDVLVVDSNSDDGTQDIAKSLNVPLINFIWNGQYPKKRQWILDNIPLKHDYVFFIDADEEMTPNLRAELQNLKWDKAGYFVRGAYVVNGKVLKYGLQNNKLCLFDKRYIEFPVVDDLDIEGMGEIEGHYQPVLKRIARGMKIGQLKHALNHYAMEDMARWNARHDGYSKWQASIAARGAMPRDVNMMRSIIKKLFHLLPFQNLLAFVYTYIFKRGFLDGKRGFDLSFRHSSYYADVKQRAILDNPKA